MARDVFVDLPALHDNGDVPVWIRQEFDVRDEVAFDQQKIRISTFLNHTQFPG